MPKRFVVRPVAVSSVVNDRSFQVPSNAGLLSGRARVMAISLGQPARQFSFVYVCGAGEPFIPADSAAAVHRARVEGRQCVPRSLRQSRLCFSRARAFRFNFNLQASTSERRRSRRGGSGVFRLMFVVSIWRIWRPVHDHRNASNCLAIPILATPHGGKAASRSIGMTRPAKKRCDSRQACAANH